MGPQGTFERLPRGGLEARSNSLRGPTILNTSRIAMPLEGQARKENARMYYRRHKGKLSADEAEELRQRLETLNAPLTLSDLFQTFSDLFSNFSHIFKHFSDLFGAPQPFSNLFYIRPRMTRSG